MRLHCHPPPRNQTNPHLVHAGVVQGAHAGNDEAANPEPRPAAAAAAGGALASGAARGGGQEREMRAGTENVAAIAGFGAAVKWRSDRPMAPDARDAFLGVLSGRWLPTAKPSETLAGHAHGRFPGVSAETLLIRLDRMGIAASSGAACSSGSIEPSHVLQSAGYSEEEAKEGVRFSFGILSTQSDAVIAAEIVLEEVAAISGTGD